jgi:hypothetical protein|tara:strand:+ start:331 stop:504 length:174 start_codon:yes stop_codon:yes gene_type:complete
MSIDAHSLTWKAVEKFIEQEKDDAIDYLIADRDSERQRGALALLEKLETLGRQSEPA